ncbi:MAG: hypothetical protein KC503_42305 [Myxococcales bacterium]|nr:hypothetical protein [Myxococcales bacterium]
MKAQLAKHVTTFVLAAMVWLTSACGPSLMSHDATDGMSVLVSASKRPRPATRSPLVVHLKVAKSYGCFFPVAIARPGAMVCKAFPAASIDEVKRSFSAKLSSKQISPAAFGFDNVRDLFVAVLKKRLGSRFDLRFSPRPSEGAVTIEAGFDFGFFVPRYTAKTRLAVRLASGQQLSSDGQGETRFNHGHLGWMIPVAVISLPIGLPIVMAIGGSIHTGLREEALALSVDSAAQKLAARLASATPGMLTRRTAERVGGGQP